MNDILKQRLVGALVLIALGVLFWPVIFVETDRRTVDTTPQVTPMPQLAEVEIAPPQPLPDVTPVAAADAMREASESAAADDVEATAPDRSVPDDTAVAPDSPALDDAGIPVAWVLQVATVRTRERAEQLTEVLIEAGYKAYSRTTRKEGEQLYRVFVGPVFQRDRLIEAKQDIDRRLDVSAIVARYVP